MTYFELGCIHNGNDLVIRHIGTGLINSEEVFDSIENATEKGSDGKSKARQLEFKAKQLIEMKAMKIAEEYHHQRCEDIVIVGPHMACSIDDTIDLNGRENGVMQPGDIWGFDVLSYKFPEHIRIIGSSSLLWNKLPDAIDLGKEHDIQFFGIPLSFSILGRAALVVMAREARDFAYTYMMKNNFLDGYRRNAFNYFVVGPVQQMGEPDVDINASKKNGYRFSYLPYVLFNPLK